MNSIREELALIPRQAIHFGGAKRKGDALVTLEEGDKNTYMSTSEEFDQTEGLPIHSSFSFEKIGLRETLSLGFSQTNDCHHPWSQ